MWNIYKNPLKLLSTLRLSDTVLDTTKVKKNSREQKEYFSSVQQVIQTKIIKDASTFTIMIIAFIKEWQVQWQPKEGF